MCLHLTPSIDLIIGSLLIVVSLGFIFYVVFFWNFRFDYRRHRSLAAAKHQSQRKSAQGYAVLGAHGDLPICGRSLFGEVNCLQRREMEWTSSRFVRVLS